MAHTRTGAQAKPHVARPTSAGMGLLTEREREIVRLVARGLTNHDIAKLLFISPLTAKTHVNRAMVKLEAKNRAQLVVAVLDGETPAR